ncbi:hypothetical protein AB0C14_38570 [Microbispora hainanensis]|uniref:hypothetical protein n=1 Tax=Microbispora hainanensis TaxID=568844 RepID=UPI00340C8C1D
MAMTSKPEFDALGLLSARRHTSVRFGSTEAEFCVTHVSMKNALNDIPDAQVDLDLSVADFPVDYFSMMSIAIVDGGQRSQQFLGSIVRAYGAGSDVSIEAVGAVSLAEKLMGDMVTRNIPGAELVYTLARGAGFSESALRIQGLENLPCETFEVIAPIDDVDVRAPTTFANLKLITADMVEPMLDGLDITDDLRDRYKAKAYAYTLVTARRCLDAEEQGLAAIDLAMAWMTVRLRYGLAVLPDGGALSFDRGESLARPRRRDLVVVRGLTTLRGWLRSPDSVERTTTAVFNPNALRFNPLLPELTMQERLAILALARATQERHPLAQVQAIFESIEFYASGATVPELFSKADRRQLRAVLPDSLTNAQRKRIEQLMGDLNSAPLRLRLARVMDDDEVPITDEELDLLWKLRQLRNDVVHGRRSDLPAAEDVEYGISLVARMLVHRVAKISRNLAKKPMPLR